MKAFVPFYDAYVLIEAKEKTQDHVADCIIDRRYTKLQYMVFAGILKDSDENSLETNLRQPGKWIDEALKAQAARKVEQAAPETPAKTTTTNESSLLARSILRSENSIEDKLGANLLKESLTHEAVDNYRSQIALQHQSKEEIEKALQEAVEIIFDAETEDLPLYASAHWQFLVDLRYRFDKLKNVQKSIRRSNTIAKKKAKGVSNGRQMLGENTNRGTTPQKETI